MTNVKKVYVNMIFDHLLKSCKARMIRPKICPGLFIFKITPAILPLSETKYMYDSAAINYTEKISAIKENGNHKFYNEFC